MKIQQRGFTLVELSIVLVIIGLLVGGVLTGQSLIHAAELRSLTSQYQRYEAAVMTFRDKYFALPGDMTNATAYWGAADGSTGLTAACKTTASTTSATCNGNGDGQILTDSYSNELFRFWQHLANAGLIEGSYDGITHGTNDYSATVVNSPSGRISSSIWYVAYFGPRTAQLTLFDGDYGNALMVGTVLANNQPSNNMLKSEDVYNIDTKLDDGKPATGRIVNYGPFATCTDQSASTALTANYLLTNTSLACAPMLRNQF